MASEGKPLLVRASDFISNVGVELARRHDRAAKREREGDVVLQEEADACGWSSAVLERSLALRRRRRPAYSGCDWVASVTAAVAEDEHVSSPEVPAAVSPALKSESAEENIAVVNTNDMDGIFFLFFQDRC